MRILKEEGRSKHKFAKALVFCYATFLFVQRKDAWQLSFYNKVLCLMNRFLESVHVKYLSH